MGKVILTLIYSSAKCGNDLGNFHIFLYKIPLPLFLVRNLSHPLHTCFKRGEGK